MATAGETADSSERRQLGQYRWQPELQLLRRGDQRKAPSNHKKKHPQGFPRGGVEENPNRTDLTETNSATNKRTNVVCSCGKVCKNETGLKIHKTKMACLAENPGHCEESGTSTPLVPAREPTAMEQPCPEQTLNNPTDSNTQSFSTVGMNEILSKTRSPASTRSKCQCTCGKRLKNEKGLKIHQSKMSCALSGQLLQRAGEVPGPSIEVPDTDPDKTEEEPGPESPHRARSLQAAPVQSSSSRPEKHQIKWPTAKEEWSRFDDDLNAILKSTAKGSAEQNLLTMCTLITRIGAERFGESERHHKDSQIRPNRRGIKISQLRLELKSLRKQFKATDDEREKLALAELREIIRKKLMSLRRAEQHRKNGKERARKRKAFISNPFHFSKNLLGQKKSGFLSCSEEVMNSHLKSTFSDSAREKDLGPCKNLIEPPEPAVGFITREPTFGEVKNVVTSSRSCSAPGPSGVPYKVYKHCPGLLVRLWKILKVLWRKGRIPSQWKSAEGTWIPKEENSCNIQHFRIISLLCVEAKIFFKIMSQRLMEFVLKNNYLDTSVQKGGVPGVPGCLEHTGVATQLIREAKKSKGDLAMLWLDLTNAYGSVPHKLVELTLIKYHIPESIRNIISEYYGNYKFRVLSRATTLSWQKLEKGIITGCTISVSLSTLAMELIV